MNRRFLCASLAVATATLGMLAGSGSADAQYYYRGYHRPYYYSPLPPFPPPPPRVIYREYREPLPPWEIETILRSMGYSQVSRPQFAGAVYWVHATTPRRARVRMAVDSHTGQIVERDILGTGFRPTNRAPSPTASITSPQGRPRTDAAKPRRAVTPPAAVGVPSRDDVQRAARGTPTAPKPTAPAQVAPAQVAPAQVAPAQVAPPNPMTPTTGLPSGGKPAVGTAGTNPSAVPPLPTTPAQVPLQAKPMPADAKPLTVTPTVKPVTAPANTAKPATDASRPVWAQRRSGDSANPPPAQTQPPAQPTPPARKVDMPPVQGFE